MIDRTSLPWLRQQLDRYTYRPGWSLTIQPSAPFVGDLFHLTVVYPAADSRDPTRTDRLRFNTTVPPYIAEQRDEDLFAKWLQSALFDVERHESQEWLRRDGQIYDDPHGR